MMDYGRLGERPRGVQLPLLEIISTVLLMGAILIVMVELVSYSDQKDDLPTDLTVAGIPVGGLTEVDAQARWEEVYLEQPVQLYYEDSLILLDPIEIGFRVNSDVMLAEARAQGSAVQNFWAGFWNYLERQPVSAVTVPLIADYDPGDLRAYLQTLAARYDSPPGSVGFDRATLTFTSGTEGRVLDIDAAMPLIDAALRNPRSENRLVRLPTLDAGAAQRDMDTLAGAIIELLASMGFPYDGQPGGTTLASVYIVDLATGEELSLLGDVPHSARSVIKIPIMVNLFREELLLPQDIAYLLTESILCSNNSASNFLIQWAGSGDGFRSEMSDGLNQVSCTAQALGADQTFISAPLFVADEAYQFEAPVCRPENPGDTGFNTNADPFSQTTAEDIGLLLTEIYDCANYGSGLMALYPEDITQTECQQMIEVLSGNRIDRLIELGVPLGTKVAHKNGWGIETAVDSGIVFSPGGDYVLSMITWEADTDNNQLTTLLSWEAIEEVSRLVWNYFNPDQPMLLRREPINPYTAIDCVTVSSEELVDLNDIDRNRLDEGGNPLPTACYGGAASGCRAFAGWDQ